MAGKAYKLDSGFEVTVFKRRGSRNIRLTVTPHGQVRVSIPSWAPFKAGIDFAKTKQDWIKDMAIQPTELVDGQAIGKAHRLVFNPTNTEKISSRVASGNITVSLPATISISSPAVQNAANEAAVRALRIQSEKLLPQRLNTLSDQYDFDYRSLKIKRLKGRWGSCDQHNNITLNLFLMQLPWDLIDYVIIHELVHTRVLRHGPDFWAAMAEVKPDVKELRKRLRDHRPMLRSYQ